MFQGLKTKLESFFRREPKTAKAAIEALSPEDRARFDSLPPLEKADVMAMGDSFNSAKRVATLMELGHVAEAKAIQADLSRFGTPPTRSAASVTGPAATAPDIGIPTTGQKASTPSVSPAPVAVAPPAPAAAVVKPLTGLAAATASLSAREATGGARRAQAAATASAQETARLAAQKELCELTIAFDALQSQAARNAFWLLHSDRIKELAAIETVRGHGWIGDFIRRR